MKPGLLIAVVGIGSLGGASYLLGKPSGENCIGKYSTSLQGRTPNQRHNAQLSLNALQGATIGPGETFSFCNTVGSWSRDSGYKKAPVSYNGQLVDSWGGGVCQTSTTLYNAALVGGFDIVERSKHRFWPSYVPPGRDAAVAFQNIDLKFKNPYDFPIVIRGQIVGDRLEIGLYGWGKGRSVSVTSKIHERIEPNTYRFVVPGGSSRLRNTGKTGYEVSVFRMYGSKRELISRDSYPPMSRVEEVGQG